MTNDKLSEQLKQYVTSQSAIKSAVLYGSLASGQFSKESDVDIAIDLGRPMTFDEKLVYIDELNQMLKRDIDFVDLHECRGLIHYNIMTKGIRLKFPSDLWVLHMKRALYFHADFLPQLNAMSKERINRVIYE